MGTTGPQMNVNLPKIGGVDMNQVLAENQRYIRGLDASPFAADYTQAVNTDAIGRAAQMDARRAWRNDIMPGINEAMIMGGKSGSSAQTNRLVRAGENLNDMARSEHFRASVAANEAAKARQGIEGQTMSDRDKFQIQGGQGFMDLLGRLGGMAGQFGAFIDPRERELRLSAMEIANRDAMIRQGYLPRQLAQASTMGDLGIRGTRQNLNMNDFLNTMARSASKPSSSWWTPPALAMRDNWGGIGDERPAFKEVPGGSSAPGGYNVVGGGGGGMGQAAGGSMGQPSFRMGSQGMGQPYSAAAASNRAQFEQSYHGGGATPFVGSGTFGGENYAAGDIFSQFASMFGQGQPAATMPAGGGGTAPAPATWGSGAVVPAATAIASGFSG